MALEETSTVDAIGIHKQTDEAVLTLIDGEDWGDESRHLRLLQEKLNAYLRFIESGELLEVYPKAVGKRIRIDVHFKDALPVAGERFLEEAAQLIQHAGFGFSYQVQASEEPS